jgi:hypothetical protein
LKTYEYTQQILSADATGYLDLNNFVTCKSATKIISIVLTTNIVLIKINLKDNDLKCYDIIVLVNLLVNNYTLPKLYLHNNKSYVNVNRFMW